MIDPFKIHRARPISEHISDYVADMRTAGRAPKYVENINNRLKRLADACGWKTLGSIDPNSYCRWREKQKAAPHRGARADAKTTAAETLNQYLETARAFCNWCAANNRMPGVPMGNGRVMATALAGVSMVEGEKVRKRRALSDEEVAKLLGVAPAERKIVYRVGLGLGLRRAEIEALKWGDLRLVAIKPYAQLRAEATKARRGDRLPISQTLAEDLRKHRPADASDNDRVFPIVPKIALWREDLAAAEITEADAMGRRADFHGGTRKTLCTRMHRNAVAPAVAMKLMRHTDIRLTMVDYNDDEQIGVDAGVLPEIQAAVMAAKNAPAAAAAGA